MARPSSPALKRLAIGVVSAGTALWLVAQLYVGLTVNHGPWPVVGYGMASQSEPAFVTPSVRASLADGRSRVIAPADLDLTTDQLRRYVLRKVVDDRGVRHPGGAERLERLVRAWERRAHRRVVGAQVELLVQPLPSGAPSRRTVFEWRSS